MEELESKIQRHEAPALGRPTRCRNVVSTFSRAPKNIVFAETSFFLRVEFDFSQL